MSKKPIYVRNTLPLEDFLGDGDPPVQELGAPHGLPVMQHVLPVVMGTTIILTRRFDEGHEGADQHQPTQHPQKSRIGEKRKYEFSEMDMQ